MCLPLIFEIDPSFVYLVPLFISFKAFAINSRSSTSSEAILPINFYNFSNLSTLYSLETIGVRLSIFGLGDDI